MSGELTGINSLPLVQAILGHTPLSCGTYTKRLFRHYASALDIYESPEICHAVVRMNEFIDS